MVRFGAGWETASELHWMGCTTVGAGVSQGASTGKQFDLSGRGPPVTGMEFDLPKCGLVLDQTRLRVLEEAVLKEGIPA